jgi:hypothetical protein
MHIHINNLIISYRHIAGTFVYVIIRKTREGWPLLTVETKANWDSKSTNERGSFLVWFVGLFVPVQETFILPWLLWSAQYKIFILTVRYFNLCAPPNAQQPWQAAVQGRLSLNVCLRL